MTLAALLHGPEAPDPAVLWERTADTLAAYRAARATDEGAALAGLWPGDAQLAGEAAVIRYSECDPIHVPTCLTADAITVPVALAFARDHARYLRAVAAGTAVGLRLARAVGGAAALNHGVWPALFAASAVAAVTATVARAAEGVTEAALSLSLGGISGRAGRPVGFPSGRWVMFGEAVSKGLRAADAAIAGAAGDPGLISQGWLTAQAAPGLADMDALRGPDYGPQDIGLKPYVAARQGTTAIATLRDLLAQGVDPAAITAVEVALPPDCLGVVTRPVTPGNRLSAVANLPLALGLAAFAPGTLLDIARAAPAPLAALDLAAKVTVTGDPALDRGAEGIWPAVVTVTTPTGQHRLRRDLSPGDATDPARRVMLRAKLQTLKADDLLMTLEQVTSNDPDGGLAAFRAAHRQPHRHLQDPVGTLP